MTRRVLAFDVDPACLAALCGALPGGGFELKVAREADAPQALRQNGASSAVVVIGAEVTQPLVLAQRAFAAAPQTPVVLVAQGARRADIEASLRFAPRIGRVMCVEPQSPGAVQRAVASVVLEHERRLSHDLTLAALNRRLAAESRPPSRAGTLLEQVLRHAPVGIVFTSASREILSWNPRASELFRASERDVLGTRLEERVAPQARDQFSKLFEQSREGGGPAKATLRIAAGEHRYAEFTVAQVDALADRARFVVAVSDVSELMQAMRSLERAVSLRDEFLSIASHELNTPLTPMKLQLSILTQSLATRVQDPAARLWLETKLRSVEKYVLRLERLIADLLDVSRLTARGVALNRTRVNLAELVRSVAARFTAEVERADIRFRGPPEVLGDWDASRIDIVVANLLSNAVKYGQGRPVQVDVEQDATRARLRVADQGIGIPPAAQARIFELFERAVSARNFGGFGIGLFTAKSIVEAHGGTLEVASVEGEGSVFTMTLPRWAKA